MKGVYLAGEWIGMAIGAVLGGAILLFTLPFVAAARRRADRGVW